VSFIQLSSILGEVTLESKKENKRHKNYPNPPSKGSIEEGIIDHLVS